MLICAPGAPAEGPDGQGEQRQIVGQDHGDMGEDLAIASAGGGGGRLDSVGEGQELRYGLEGPADQLRWEPDPAAPAGRDGEQGPADAAHRLVAHDAAAEQADGDVQERDGDDQENGQEQVRRKGEAEQPGGEKGDEALGHGREDHGQRVSQEKFRRRDGGGEQPGEEGGGPVLCQQHPGEQRHKDGGGYELGNGVDENKDQADQYVARMNYYAAKALLARVYLDMGGEYKKEARRLAEEVIESKKFALLDYEKSLNVDMADKDLLFSSEHIFSLRNQAIKTGAEAIHKRVTGSDGNLQMAVGFQSSIYEGDLDDYRLNWYSEIYIVKYTSDNSKRFFPKVPIIRLSEMYLIAAEGWMEDDPGHAAELLQTFKQARTHKEVVSQEVTEDVIMREIRKEFIGEGVIFLTYKRLHHDIWGNTSEDQVKADNNVFVFPIPEDEIEYGNRTQN